MIREVIRPIQNDFHIYIPTEYLNKDVEFIMFPLDEQEHIQEVEIPKEKSLRGVFNSYSDDIKVALEDNAWQLNVMKKFKKHD
ncbi:MAG: hypothetical protein GQ570_14950 [Helicobacteraceae bacterium]|nr:hypothetical protein [Helicobacteraceae bacterium]